MKNKFKIMQLIKYTIVGAIIGGFILSVVGMVGQGIGNQIKTALTQNREQTIQTYSRILNASDMVEYDISNFQYMQENYDEITKQILEKGHTKNIDGVAFKTILNMGRLSNILVIKYIFDFAIAGIIIGAVVGIIMNLITNIKIKYNFLKIIMGYVATGIISILMAATFSSIMYKDNLFHEAKVIFTYHPVEFIATTIAIYVAMITINLVVQKIKANKFNKELSK